MSPAQPVHGPYFVNDEKAAICAPYGVLCMFTEWDDEDKATAQLMAAALEMLAALKRVKTVMDGIVHPSCRRPDDALSEVEAAIAKAEGRP